MRVLRFDATARRISDLVVDATAARQSLDADALYVASGTQLKAIDAGTRETATWRSRRFSMPNPEGFGWAQINADFEEGVVLKLYVDGVLIYTSPTILSKEPFRLPAVKGRRWELELVSKDKVTSLEIAQAAQELMS